MSHNNEGKAGALLAAVTLIGMSVGMVPVYAADQAPSGTPGPGTPSTHVKIDSIAIKQNSVQVKGDSNQQKSSNQIKMNSQFLKLDSQHIKMDSRQIKGESAQHKGDSNQIKMQNGIVSPRDPQSGLPTGK